MPPKSRTTYKKVDTSLGEGAANGGAPAAPITGRETCLLLWMLLNMVIAFGAGALLAQLHHRAGHHVTDSQGSCTSARLCSAFMPRSMCAIVLDA